MKSIGPRQAHLTSVVILSILGLASIAFSVICSPVGLGTADQRRQIKNVGRVHLSGFDGSLRFEPNLGQTNSDVKYVARGRGYSLSVTGDEALLSVVRPPASSRDALDLKDAWKASQEVGRVYSASMKIVGASHTASVVAEQELPGKSNYFIGNDPAQWRTNVPTYAKTRYKNVYPGIDLVYYGNQGQLEYDFVVAPGADPNAIRLAFQSSDGSGIQIDPQGNLTFEGDSESIVLHRPIVHQEANGTRHDVDGSFQIKTGNEVGFDLARYDTSKPLVIDPVLSYSTYLGGSALDAGRGIAIDSSGNVYIIGSTNSPNFPVLNGFQSTIRNNTQTIFVAKFSSTGSLVYSTLIGGSGNDSGIAIAVDSAGEAFITGGSTSPDFPVLNALQPTNHSTRGFANAIITKFNASGSGLMYSTFLGGTTGEGGTAIAVDPSGNAYVAGTTTSTNFPTVNAVQPTFGGGSTPDAFISKINAAGSALVYSTYLGGPGDDFAQGIAVDSSGSAYITGLASAGFPTFHAIQPALRGIINAFVAKLSPSGSALVYSTFLGGSNQEAGFGIAVDSSGNAYVAGQAESVDFPVVNPFQPVFGGGRDDAFVSKINAAGSALVYSTFLGGTGLEVGSGIAIDASGNAYVIGSTTSTNFPTANAIQAALGGNGLNNAFVTELNSSGSAAVYSTYLGGSGSDVGFGVAVDPSGNAYIVGRAESVNFPTVNAFQSALAGMGNAFVAKIAPTASATPAVFAGGLVNAASFALAPAPVAPGTIAAIFGSNLNDGSVITSTSFGANGKLVTTLGGASVMINGVAAPMFASIHTPAYDQLTVQIPFEVAGQTTATAQVSVGGLASAAANFNIAATAPGVFTANAQGTGAGAITHVDGTAISPSSPAHPNDVIVMYATGLGVLSPSLATGAPSAGNLTAPSASVTVDGIAANVSFSGTTPGLVGLNQINFQVPPGTRSAPDIPVVLKISGVASNSVTMAVGP